MWLYVLACTGDSDRPAKPPDEPDPPEVATTQELVDAFEDFLCEADQGCVTPAFGSARECECAGITGDAYSEVDGVQARACIDALVGAQVDACNPFDVTVLPDPCWDLLSGPDAPYELLLFAVNARYTTLYRDCHDLVLYPCDLRRPPPDEACEVDQALANACLAGEWSCEGDLPAECLHFLVCP